MYNEDEEAVWLDLIVTIAYPLIHGAEMLPEEPYQCFLGSTSAS